MPQTTTLKKNGVVGKPILVTVAGQHNKYCDSVGGATINVTVPPKLGSVSSTDLVDYVIGRTGDGRCIGVRQKGTGVYYTATAAGHDRFEFDEIFRKSTYHWIVDTTNR